MTTQLSRRFGAMGTVVEIRVIAKNEGRLARRGVERSMEAGEAWFARVERDCSRFDPASELRRLCGTVETPRRVTPLLYSAIHFALAVAQETEGAFDPTVGARMERLGFDRHHGSGRATRSSGGDATWRDVALDDATSTVTLLRPLTLDLGAVAKGLAIDLAARELAPVENFAIDAGGDLYLGGGNDGAPWSVAIRHPRGEAHPLDTVRVSNLAVCTSGDYERRSPGGDHHIVDPRMPGSPRGVASVTVIGESAMVADAMATATFVLGPDEGLDLLERHRLEGLIATESLEVITSKGWEALRQ